MGDSVQQQPQPPEVSASIFNRVESPGHWCKARIAASWLALTLLVAMVVVAVTLLNKPWVNWVSFAADFATSPAMAGLAAVTAAIIGATALQKQLRHTKDEASHRRKVDIEASWWEKFEWVTDRILPKEDTKQTKLHPDLALSLAVSLQNMSTAEFQKEAVSGVIIHYLSPKIDSNSDAPTVAAAERFADPASLRAFINATGHSASPENTRMLNALLYEREVLHALESNQLTIGATENESARLAVEKFKVSPDAIVNIDGIIVFIETKAATRLNALQFRRIKEESDQLSPLGIRVVIVTTAKEFKGRFTFPTVSWEASKGSDNLEMLIRHALVRTFESELESI